MAPNYRRVDQNAMERKKARAGFAESFWYFVEKSGKLAGKSDFATKEPDPLPIALVHMNVYSSSVTSIEGYNHDLIITDSCSEHRWQYGMKTKDEVFARSRDG